jgi:hypothetical protein
VWSSAPVTVTLFAHCLQCLPYGFTQRITKTGAGTAADPIDDAKARLDRCDPLAQRFESPICFLWVSLVVVIVIPDFEALGLLAVPSP